jgi:hypothetical protein
MQHTEVCDYGGVRRKYVDIGGKTWLGAQMTAAVISNVDECLFYSSFVQPAAQLHFPSGLQAHE